MKFLFLILLFPLIVKSKIIQGPFDKELHYGCGLLISFMTGEVVYQLTDNNAMSLSTGILFGAGAGYAKEKYDHDVSKKPFDLGDFGATAWGASHGAICLRVRIDIGEKRRQRREDKEFEKLQFLKQII